MNSFTKRRHSKPAFYPGWKMTEIQRNAYFWMFGRVCEILNCPSSERTALRHRLHVQAFKVPKSAKDIDHLKGYDAIKAVFMAVIKPDDVSVQMRQIDQPRIRLMNAIREWPEAYWKCLLHSPRFNKEELEDCNEKELTDLRNTLCDRKPEHPAPAPEAVPVEDGVEVPF